MKRASAGGGWTAIRYALRKSREAGGFWAMWKALRSKNTCKTCALGMGGQRGGMVNERGSFPEVCKKSIQAMTADMQPGIPAGFWPATPVSRLQTFSPYQLEHCGRLIHPLMHARGEGGYRVISWEEAMDAVVRHLQKTTPDETFWYFSGRSSNEAGFLLQLAARLFGTNNVNNCSFYCHQASGVGLSSSIGNGTATVLLEDVEKADLVFVIGGNPASNHPRFMSTLKHIRRHGGKVIVINPVVETGLVRFRIPSDPISLLFGTRIATRYVQPHIGGDLALLTGIAKKVDELGGADSAFLEKHCEGVDPWLHSLRQTNWSEVAQKSGVTEREIEAIARDYVSAKKVVFSWTMGITHHSHGVENVQAISNLALMRGMVGRRSMGLLPIRGHSNVQGIGSVGVTPRLSGTLLENLRKNYSLDLPTTNGLDTLSCMEAAHERRMKAAVCLGGNLYGSNPDASFAGEALSRLDFIAYLSTTLNTGHAHGLARETLILPVLARDEEPQPTTQESMFNYVRFSDGGPARHRGPRSEVEVIADLAKRLIGLQGSLDWSELSHTRNIRRMIANVIPGWDQIKQIDDTRREFQIAGRTLHTPHFPTPTGKAMIHAHELPPLNGAPDELRLMTVRSEGQFNTVVYEEEDVYRGQERRDVILLHPDDIARRSLRVDQLVTVRSESGALSGIRVRSFAQIRSGNALMYYPEANVLVPRRADPASRTPAFKNVAVRLESAK
jgi:molybdopterin-dependent oxidoreductase alpha subunit